MPGQSNPNPLSLFGTHQVVRLGAPLTYYDASYGGTHSSLSVIDSTVVSGFVKTTEPERFYAESIVGVDLNGDFDMLDTVRMKPYFIKSNPVGNQLEESPYEWPP